jgi:hypothetical protein
LTRRYPVYRVPTTTNEDVAAAVVKEVAAVAKETVVTAAAKEVTAEATAKAASDATPDSKAAVKKAATSIWTSGSGGGGSGTAHADVGKAPDATPDLKMTPKRATTVTRSGVLAPLLSKSTARGVAKAPVCRTICRFSFFFFLYRLIDPCSYSPAHRIRM